MPWSFGRRRAVEKKSRVIALTGLSFEARIAGGEAIISDGLQTSAILKSAVGQHSRGIISFGVCGGLAPDLQPGQWIVASSILFRDEIHDTDRRWSERLLQLLPGARYARIASVDCPLPVLNPAHRKLPAAALLKLKQGSPDLRAILRYVLAEPGQVRDLMRLAFDAAIAKACLRQAKLLLGPNLGFPEPDESFAGVPSRSVGQFAYATCEYLRPTPGQR